MREHGNSADRWVLAGRRIRRRRALSRPARRRQPDLRRQSRNGHYGRRREAIAGAAESPRAGQEPPDGQDQETARTVGQAGASGGGALYGSDDRRPPAPRFVQRTPGGG